MSLSILELWNKLPLAESFWLLLRHVWPSESLDQFYNQHRGRGYQRKIAFSEIVAVLIQAITLKKGRAHPVLLDQQEELPASIPAIYGKIRRTPRKLSHALIPADAARHRPLLPANLAAPPVGVSGVQKFRHLVFDGHTLKRASKRLQKVRGTPGRALGGKLLAVLEVQSDLVVGLNSGAHAHVNEQALLPALLDQIRASLPGPRLWIADRAFGNLANFKRCTAEGDHCILRKTSRSVFTPGSRPAIIGTDAQGRTYRDEIGTLSSAREGKQAARQITVERPGLKPLVLLTSLLDPVEYPANDILELYRKRWSIEQKFQKVSELFTMGPYCSSTPNGILFHSALCLMLANNLTVLQTLLAQEQGREAKTVSTHHLFEGIREELVVCKKLMPLEELVESLQDRLSLPPAGDWLEYVKSLLGKAWQPKFVKSPPKKRHLPKAKHRRGTAGHFSIQKVLEEAKAKPKPKKRAAPP
jgi:hypothetical protein